MDEFVQSREDDDLFPDEFEPVAVPTITVARTLPLPPSKKIPITHISILVSSGLRLTALGTSRWTAFSFSSASHLNCSGVLLLFLYDQFNP